MIEVMWGRNLLSIEKNTVIEDEWWELMLYMQKVPDSFLGLQTDCYFLFSWYPLGIQDDW